MVGIPPPMPHPRAVREPSMVLQGSGQTEGKLLGSKFPGGGSLESGTIFLHFLWEHWRGQLLKREHECHPVSYQGLQQGRQGATSTLLYLSFPL